MDHPNAIPILIFAIIALPILIALIFIGPERVEKEASQKPSGAMSNPSENQLLWFEAPQPEVPDNFSDDSLLVDVNLIMDKLGIGPELIEHIVIPVKGRLSIEYKNSEGEKSQRDIQAKHFFPTRLEIEAFCETREADRTFKIDNITTCTYESSLLTQEELLALLCSSLIDYELLEDAKIRAEASLLRSAEQYARKVVNSDTFFNDSRETREINWTDLRADYHLDSGELVECEMRTRAFSPSDKCFLAKLKERGLVFENWVVVEYERLTNITSLESGESIPDLEVFFDEHWEQSPIYLASILWTTKKNALKAILYAGKNPSFTSARKKILYEDYCHVLGFPPLTYDLHGELFDYRKPAKSASSFQKFCNAAIQAEEVTNSNDFLRLLLALAESPKSPNGKGVKSRTYLRTKINALS